MIKEFTSQTLGTLRSSVYLHLVPPNTLTGHGA